MDNKSKKVGVATTIERNGDNRNLMENEKSLENEDENVDVTGVSPKSGNHDMKIDDTFGESTEVIISNTPLQCEYAATSPQPGPSGIQNGVEDEIDIDSDDSIKIVEVPKKTFPLIVISDSSSDSEVDVITTVSKKKRMTKDKPFQSIRERLEEQKDKLFPENLDPEKRTEKSPDKHDSMCAICLGTFKDRAFLEKCFHNFCFTCILQWSKVVQTCPLCKTPFQSIIHNIKPDLKYHQYFVKEKDKPSPTVSTFITEGLFEIGPRFRYPTTQTAYGNRTSSWYRQHRHDLLGSSQGRRSRNRWGRFSSTWGTPAGEEQRRSIYRSGMVIKEVRHPPGRVRYRDTSVEFFQSNPAILHRLVPWILRDLRIILQNESDHSLVLHQILSLLERWPMESEEFYNEMLPYLHNDTRQFIRELISFAGSPYDMRTYDSKVVHAFPLALQQGTSSAATNEHMLDAGPSDSETSTERNCENAAFPATSKDGRSVMQNGAALMTGCNAECSDVMELTPSVGTSNTAGYTGRQGEKANVERAISSKSIKGKEKRKEGLSLTSFVPRSSGEETFAGSAEEGRMRHRSRSRSWSRNRSTESHSSRRSKDKHQTHYRRNSRSTSTSDERSMKRTSRESRLKSRDRNRFSRPSNSEGVNSGREALSGRGLSRESLTSTNSDSASNEKMSRTTRSRSRESGRKRRNDYQHSKSSRQYFEKEQGDSYRRSTFHKNRSRSREFTEYLSNEKQNEKHRGWFRESRSRSRESREYLIDKRQGETNRGRKVHKSRSRSREFRDNFTDEKQNESCGWSTFRKSRSRSRESRDNFTDEKQNESCGGSTFCESQSRSSESREYLIDKRQAETNNGTKVHKSRSRSREFRDNFTDEKQNESCGWSMFRKSRSRSRESRDNFTDEKQNESCGGSTFCESQSRSSESREYLIDKRQAETNNGTKVHNSRSRSREFRDNFTDEKQNESCGWSTFRKSRSRSRKSRKNSYNEKQVESHRGSQFCESQPELRKSSKYVDDGQHKESYRRSRFHDSRSRSRELENSRKSISFGSDLRDCRSEISSTKSAMRPLCITIGNNYHEPEKKLSLSPEFPAKAVLVRSKIVKIKRKPREGNCKNAGTHLENYDQGRCHSDSDNPTVADVAEVGEDSRRIVDESALADDPETAALRLDAKDARGNTTDQCDCEVEQPQEMSPEVVFEKGILQANSLPRSRRKVFWLDRNSTRAHHGNASGSKEETEKQDHVLDGDSRVTDGRDLGPRKGDLEKNGENDYCEPVGVETFVQKVPAVFLKEDSKGTDATFAPQREEFSPVFADVGKDHYFEPAGKVELVQSVPEVLLTEGPKGTDATFAPQREEFSPVFADFRKDNYFEPTRKEELVQPVPEVLLTEGPKGTDVTFASRRDKFSPVFGDVRKDDYFEPAGKEKLVQPVPEVLLTEGPKGTDVTFASLREEFSPVFESINRIDYCETAGKEKLAQPVPEAANKEDPKRADTLLAP